MKTAEDSLKRFGLDHVDVLLLPFAGKREFIIFEPVLEAMTELKKQGKIRFAGIATHSGCDVALKMASNGRGTLDFAGGVGRPRGLAAWQWRGNGWTPSEVVEQIRGGTE